MIAAADHARHDKHRYIAVPVVKMHEPALLLLLLLTGIDLPSFKNALVLFSHLQDTFYTCFLLLPMNTRFLPQPSHSEHRLLIDEVVAVSEEVLQGRFEDD